ncbi:uncharacterized protein (DUF1810 family) [Brevundimonas vesicularis]|uniref:Uncharacterized protein (DUF1810 family) n=1 Tax=Brevundimonas vesicularis TaxID=41276 RepID=A0A7W9FWY4_BREVE|nr:DUF1810 domain-containing protein [Brevundimonas vesicularis]MBB5773102.1 uncharacterized protein (DUF1810 family) [Brevundimonas vesicularis]
MTTTLDRFVAAQDPVFETAMAELVAGRKTSHWMWFVFPQARSLGRSSTAAFYGIWSLEEAQAYLAHTVLGARLARATHTATTAPAASLHQLFGSPDDLKFRSSMTLFAAVAADPTVFEAALTRWGLSADPLTADLVSTARTGPDRL